MQSYKVETSSGEFYYKIGSKTCLHREDGPAVIKNVDGKKITIYYQNNKRHRIDGYAYTYEQENIGSFQEYWYNGVYYNCETLLDFKKLTSLKNFK